MKRYVILCMLILTSALVSAQDPTEIQQEAMEKLSWLEGTWKGEAWTQKYQWHAWRIPGGIFSEHEPQLSEKGFTWAMEVPSGKIRYEVTHTEEDGWFETGEFSSDGESWTKFFEMDLKRADHQETKR